MKKLLYCFALFAVTSIVCLIVAYGITRYSVRQEQAVPNTVIETETVNDVDDRAAMNQEQVKPILESVSPAEEYYLVSESGFLLVFCSDRSTICLYTHIPVTDFPEKEREKLMEGIWFPSMMDVYHYLESYTKMCIRDRDRGKRYDTQLSDQPDGGNRQGKPPARGCDDEQ